MPCAYTMNLINIVHMFSKYCKTQCYIPSIVCIPYQN